MNNHTCTFLFHGIVNYAITIMSLLWSYSGVEFYSSLLLTFHIYETFSGNEKPYFHPYINNSAKPITAAKK